MSRSGSPRPAATDQGGAPLRSVTLLRGAVAAVAAVVVVQAALGFTGHLGAAPVALAVVSAIVVLGWLAAAARTGARAAAREPLPWNAGDVAGAFALAAALAERAWAALHRRTFLYDVLSYHLHLPAAWRAAGRIQIVPTPFGDPAPAYAPANAELIYQLALAATGNVRLAHAGQLPFAALAALGIFATARVLGAARAVGFAAALGFLLIPEVWQQAASAMADLTLAAFFVAALPFLLRLERRRTWPDLLGLGLALGLLLGTKYVALVLMLPLWGWTALVLGRRRPGVSRPAAIAAVLALVVTSGGFWYLRNTVLTGNPFFPVTAPLIGHLGASTLGRGLYDGATMREWTYHWPVNDVHPLLDIFIDTGWGFLAALLVAVVRARRTRWPWLALGLAALGWVVVPYQQSRFFFPVWAVGALTLAAAARDLPPRPGLALLALATATAGSVLQYPTWGRALVPFAGAVAAAGQFVVAPALAEIRASRGRYQFSAGAPERRRRRVARRAALVALGIGSGLATVGWARRAADAPPYAVGDDHDTAWAYLAGATPPPGRGFRIAYGGSNLPLPLWGWNLANMVRYVNVAGRLGQRLDQFPPLAAGAARSAEPAPERAHPDREDWLANLDQARIDLLFVASLYPIVEAAMTHDDDGFPVERGWADALPGRFSLIFANAGVRIYRYRPGAREGGPESAPP